MISTGRGEVGSCRLRARPDSGAAISCRSITKSRAAAMCFLHLHRELGLAAANRFEDRHVLVVDAPNARRHVGVAERREVESLGADEIGDHLDGLQIERVVRRPRHRAMEVEVEIGEQVTAWPCRAPGRASSVRSRSARSDGSRRSEAIAAVADSTVMRNSYERRRSDTVRMGGYACTPAARRGPRRCRTRAASARSLRP